MSGLSKYKAAGIDKDDTFKSEKSNAATAAFDLLVAHPLNVRKDYQKQIANAKTSAEISRILAEVREIM